jgi:hypothetical protein
VKACAALAFALGVVIGGDAGIRQRLVYVNAGECLARGSEGKLFVARAGEPCVAMKPPPVLEAPAVPTHIAEAFAEPPKREPSRVDDFPWE